MLKGSLIIQIASEGKVAIVSQYIPLAEERPTDAVLEKIAQDFLNTPNLDFLNSRQFPYKYFSCVLNRVEGQKVVILVCILDATESYEIIKIGLDDLKKSLQESLSSTKILAEKMKAAIEERNFILDKLDKPKLLQDQISAVATKLIDSGNLERAQTIIKLAKEVPSELVGAYKAGIREFKASNFRQAERKLEEAHQLALKIEDKMLIQYIALKIENTRQIPNYQREVKNLVSNILREMRKYPSFLGYDDALANARKAYDLFDILENDDKMTQISELEGAVAKSAELARLLRNTDSQIKASLKNFEETK